MTTNTALSNLLLVEDHPGHARLIEEAFRKSGLDVSLCTVTDGVEALRFLRDEESTLPDIVLLDLQLPRKNGFKMLDELEDDPELGHLPILVLSSSPAADDVLSSYESYANAYLTKSLRMEDLVELTEAIELFWGEWVQLPSQSE